MLILAHLTTADQEQVRRVLEGEAPFEPPYEGFTFEAAVYVSTELYSSSPAITAQHMAIDMGLSDGCDVVVDSRGRRLRKRRIA